MKKVRIYTAPLELLLDATLPEELCFFERHNFWTFTRVAFFALRLQSFGGLVALFLLACEFFLALLE
jgi:hypothetical protein